jgi:hypothetical protein
MSARPLLVGVASDALETIAAAGLPQLVVFTTLATTLGPLIANLIA